MRRGGPERPDRFGNDSQEGRIGFVRYKIRSERAHVLQLCGCACTVCMCSVGRGIRKRGGRWTVVRRHGVKWKCRYSECLWV